MQRQYVFFVSNVKSLVVIAGLTRCPKAPRTSNAYNAQYDLQPTRDFCTEDACEHHLGALRLGNPEQSGTGTVCQHMIRSCDRA